MSEMINSINTATLNYIKSCELVDAKDLNRLRKIHPYRGFVDVNLPSGDVITLFCNNDDMTALAFLWIKGYEEEFYSLFVWSKLCKISKNIADVGGHVGLYSLAAAKANKAAQVTAFEPVSYIYSRLCVNLAANGAAGKVKANNVGVSDRHGFTSINVRFGPSTLSKGGSLEQSGRKDSEELWIQTVSLDQHFGESDLDLMKVDVEGHEYYVLQGARNILRTQKPVILIEILPRDFGDGRTFEFLIYMGYKCYAVSEKERKLLAVENFTSNERTDEDSRNYIFVHPESKFHDNVLSLLG